MKILFVNHTFPPESYAGSELCVLNLAQEFQRRGHETAVFYRYSDSSEDEYRIRTGKFQSIPVYKINHTYRFVKSFQDLYLNPAIAAKFALVLAELKPDVVHFHHLTNLSLSLIQEAKRQECAVIMTLHDYWLLCQRGQLLKRDLSLCQGPTEEGCRSCLALPLLGGNAHRLASRLWGMKPNPQVANANAYDLMNLSQAMIHTANPEYVSKTTFGLGDTAEETLLTHPATDITYPLKFNQPVRLETAIALHPSTYHSHGKGVCFEILFNNQILYSQNLNPQKFELHQGWHPIDLILPKTESSCDYLTLQTSAEDPCDNQFCTAGWRTPKIVYTNTTSGISPISERHENFRRALYQAGEILIEAIAAFSTSTSEGISHRKQWIQRVFADTDLFISPSQFLRDFFIHHGLPEHKIVYSDNGFPVPPEIPPRPSANRPLRFGYIGTWIPSKGVDLLLQAFRGIDPTAARLMVYGFFPGYDGYPDYEQRLRLLAGPQVEFRGKYDPGLVYSILNELDCLVMPSIWWENSPLTIHEAFLARVPVITADVGGMAEQVKRGGGLTFRHRNAESLQAVIKKIIDHPEILDDLRATIPSIKAVTRHAEELLNYYSQVLQKRNSSGT